MVKVDSSTYDKTLEKDLLYIKNDLISPTNKEGIYIKFSRALNAVTRCDLKEDNYVGYWSAMYKDSPDLPIVIEACKNKFKENLISMEEMATLVKNSTDRPMEIETALKMLRRKDNECNSSIEV